MEILSCEIMFADFMLNVILLSGLCGRRDSYCFLVG